MDVSASSRYYSTTQYTSSAVENYDYRFYLKTEYHVGTTAPWDDAYIYVEAGGGYYMHRVTYYEFQAKGTSRFQHANDDCGNQTSMAYVHDGYEIPGKDNGWGYCEAKVYPKPGWGVYDINEQQKMTVFQ